MCVSDLVSGVINPIWSEKSKKQKRQTVIFQRPHVWGQGRRPGGDTPRPKPEARGDGQEELPHAPKPKAKGGGGEEQLHDWGQGWWPAGPTPSPRSSGCAGAGGPRIAIPHWRSGSVAVRRYPSSKVRSNGCALLEQPWRATPHPR